MFADALYVGDASVERVYVGDLEVWSADPSGPTLPVVVITGTSTTAARDQFRQACIDYGTTYDTVQVLPFQLDTSQATNTRSMFDDCSSLTHVPDLDTSNVTDMGRMFRNCSSLTRVPDLDTSQVTAMDRMFQGCSSLAQVPDLNTENVTDMSNMFRSCSSLTDGNVRLIGKHPNVDTSLMIRDSGLTREPFYDANGNPI